MGIGAGGTRYGVAGTKGERVHGETADIGAIGWAVWKPSEVDTSWTL